MSFKGLFRLMEGNGVEGKDVPSFGLQKEKRREKAVSKKAHRGQWVPVRNDLLLFLYRVLDTMLNYINQRHSRLKLCV